MGELRDFAIFFLLSPLFAIFIGFVGGLVASVLTRGGAARYLSRPVTLLFIGYAVIGLATLYMLADGSDGRRVGPFVGTVLSFVLVVYLRQLRRHRAASKTSKKTKKSKKSMKSGDRWRVARRSRGSVPGNTGPQLGGGGIGGTGEAGPAGWAQGLPRPVARPPTVKPPPPGATGPGGSGGSGGYGPGRPGRGGPRRFGPPDDGPDPDSEPPYGSRPPPGPV